MAYILSSDRIRFILEPDKGLWQVQTSCQGELSLKCIQSGAVLQGHGHAVFSPETVTDVHKASIKSPLGMREGIRMEAGACDGNAKTAVEFCLVDDFLCWRVTVRNLSRSPLQLDHLLLLQTPGLDGTRSAQTGCEKPGMQLNDGQGSLRVFINGWQSWSPGGSFGVYDRMPQTRYGPFLNPMHKATAASLPRDRGHFLSDMFGVTGRPGGPALLLGFLSQRQAFGQLEARLHDFTACLRLWEDADGLLLEEGVVFSSDWACLQPLDMQAAEPVSRYFSQLGKENKARTFSSVPAGWCSWYHYFQNITEKDVLENMDWIARRGEVLPLELVQLDDGFQSDIGDWYTFSSGFPDGPGRVARKIRAAGLRPGLWLAPYILKRSSDLFRNKPEWLIRNSSGRVVNAGFVWNTFTAGLDVSHPGVQDFAANLVETAVRNWGFEYLKLDFLYAGVLKGVRHDMHVTRAQAFHNGLKRIREAVGEDVDLLGCGCPLGSGIGIFDIMRIGADVAPDWRPAFFGLHFPFNGERAFPSAKNSIHSILTRMPMHRRLWVNDPDCVLLRQDESDLTPVEIRTLAAVAALSAGAFIVSDPLKLLGNEGEELLAMLLPPLNEQARVLDWFSKTYPQKLVLPLEGPSGEWFLAAYINWGETPVTVEIDPQEYTVEAGIPVHVFDIWGQNAARLAPGDTFPLHIEPHGSGLFALRKAEPLPQWVGDSLHISQGGIIRSWLVEDDAMEIELDTSQPRSGSVWLAIPGEIIDAAAGGGPVETVSTMEGITRFDIKLPEHSKLKVSWK